MTGADVEALRQDAIAVRTAIITAAIEDREQAAKSDASGRASLLRAIAENQRAIAELEGVRAKQEGPRATEGNRQDR